MSALLLAAALAVEPAAFDIAVSTEQLPANLDESDFLAAVDDTLAAYSVDHCLGTPWSFTRVAWAESAPLQIRWNSTDYPEAITSTVVGQVLELNANAAWTTTAEDCVDESIVGSHVGIYLRGLAGLERLEFSPLSCDDGYAEPTVEDGAALSEYASADLWAFCSADGETDVRCAGQERSGSAGALVWSTGARAAEVTVAIGAPLELCFESDEPACVPDACITVDTTLDEPEAEAQCGCGAGGGALLLFTPLLAFRRRS